MDQERAAKSRVERKDDVDQFFEKIRAEERNLRAKQTRMEQNKIEEIAEHEYFKTHGKWRNKIVIPRSGDDETRKTFENFKKLRKLVESQRKKQADTIKEEKRKDEKKLTADEMEILKDSLHCEESDLDGIKQILRYVSVQETRYMAAKTEKSKEDYEKTLRRTEREMIKDLKGKIPNEEYQYNLKNRSKR